jgi:hypothetical protein
VTQREIYVSVQKSGSSGKRRTYKRNEREYQDKGKNWRRNSESELKLQAAMEEFREIMKMGGRNEGGGERKRKSKTERNNGEKLGRECQNYIK